MIKAIVFDCFGVLATEAWRPFKAKYFGHDPELFARASNVSWQADRGLMSYDDFIHTVAKMAGITPAEAIAYIARNVPDEHLFAYITELKVNYKLGLLSNVAGDYMHRIFTASQLALFDVIELSFESGFIKPEKEAFAIIAKRLRVGLDECLFVDDQQRNIDGAQTAGMTAVLYHSAAQLRQELEPLLKT
jgi:putative hydrolase of the HAD superfamily